MSPTSSSLGTGRPAEGGLGMLGRYRLCSELGRGGMGVVHLAVDGRGRAVAVKVLRDHVLDDPAARARLAREVDHLSRIRHRGVAGVIDADVTGPRPYVVTRYVPGPPLDRYVAQHGPLTPEALLGLARDLSDALSAVHAAGVVHRDLKPANVLLHDGHPVLIDFGIAHGTNDARITSTGLVMGTPGFLAPEILDGAQVTAATDWWAWAATLAFAASGRIPFGDGPAVAVLARIRGGECDLTGVDPALAPLLRAALDPRPAERPTQAQILVELERYALRGVRTESMPSLPHTEVIAKAPTAPVPVVRAAPPAPGPAGPAWGAPPVGEAGWSAPVAPGAAGAAGAAGPGWGAPPATSYGREPGAYAPLGAAPYASEPRLATPYRTEPPAASRAPDPGAPPAGGVPGVPLAGGARRRTGVVLAGMVLLAALTLVAPVAALCVGVVWSWLARTVERAAVGLSLRRGEYGVRRGDVAGAVLRSPAYAVGAALGSIFGAILPAIAGSFALAGAISLQGVQVVPGSPADPSAAPPLLLAAAAALLVAWWGPGGSTLRRGTRVVARTASPGRYGPMVVIGVLLVAAAVIGLVSQSSGFEPTWAPLTEDPFEWVRGLSDSR